MLTCSECGTVYGELAARTLDPAARGPRDRWYFRDGEGRLYQNVICLCRHSLRRYMPDNVVIVQFMGQFGICVTGDITGTPVRKTNRRVIINVLGDECSFSRKTGKELDPATLKLEKGSAARILPPELAKAVEILKR